MRRATPAAKVAMVRPVTGGRGAGSGVRWASGKAQMAGLTCTSLSGIGECCSDLAKNRHLVMAALSLQIGGDSP